MKRYTPLTQSIALFVTFLIIIASIATNHKVIVATDEHGVPMVYVPGGSFRMGIDLDLSSELCLDRIKVDPDVHSSNCNLSLFAIQSPEHEVKVAGFWLDQYEFTFGQYRQCIEQAACDDGLLSLAKQYGVADGDDYPLTMVTIDMAITFCEWRGARLPTEAEWEYAARGVRGDVYPWGKAFNGALTNLCDVNCPANSTNKSVVWNDDYTFSAFIGSFEQDRSWVGAYDMFGNVSEWVDTEFALYPNAGFSDDNNLFGPSPTIRGGGYQSPHWLATTTMRLPARLDNYSSIALGFRCVRDIDATMPIPNDDNSS